MGKMKREQCKILYVQTNEIGLLDIPRALDELGYSVFKAALGVPGQGYNNEICELVRHAIENTKAQLVISYDFAETIAQACFEVDVPYISWVYDAPQMELYTHYALLPSNYVFVFDKKQRERLRDIGLANVYHIPLAVHANKVRIALEKGGEKVAYQNEIGFVGQLYRKKHIEDLIRQAPIKIQEELEQSIEQCFLKWNTQTSMHESMTEACVNYFGDIDKHRIVHDYPYATEQFFYEAAVLSRILANRERVSILNTLAEEHDVALYTFDKDTEQISDKVKVLPGAKYDYEVSNIYRGNKINLNITLHCIEKGVSQRIFDVMAAGGFMMSNYQEELEELFVPGEEIVLYHNMQELEELVDYYLAHDEEREKIARKGQDKVLRLHNYHEKMDRVVQLVTLQEEGRKESYIATQRNWLIGKANEHLSTNTDEAYLKLYEIFENPLYATAIRKNTALGTLREMLNCWMRERELRCACLLDDVNTVEEAERKYLLVKHSLWRMEQGLSEEICRLGMERIQKESISSFFLAWVIHANLDKKIETYLLLAKYMAEVNVLEAIQLLTYALFFYPKQDELLLQRADYMMELNAWKEALETLRMIEKPSVEIQGLINELENALGMNC